MARPKRAKPDTKPARPRCSAAGWPALLRPEDRARMALDVGYCATHAEAIRLQQALGRPMLAASAWETIAAQVMTLRGIRIRRERAGLEMERIDPAAEAARDMKTGAAGVRLVPADNRKEGA